MKILKSIGEKISKSIKDHFGKESSTRISSYFILSLIATNVLVFMVIDVINAIIMWNKGEIYVIPSESIWVFGLLLSHHIGLLFHKKKEFGGKNEFVAESNLDEVKDTLPVDENSEKYGDTNEEG